MSSLLLLFIGKKSYHYYQNNKQKQNSKNKKGDSDIKKNYSYITVPQLPQLCAQEEQNKQVQKLTLTTKTIF